MAARQNTLIIDNPDDKKLAFEQYRMIVESINQIHNTRETSNTFWIAANGVVISALSYAKTILELTSLTKNTFVGSMILIGCSFCLCWISYLTTIQRSLELRYEILKKIENFFPLKVFQSLYGNSDKKWGNMSLSYKELLVPCIFLMGYAFFSLDFLMAAIHGSPVVDIILENFKKP